jgi:hypothetical protein
VLLVALVATLLLTTTGARAGFVLDSYVDLGTSFSQISGINDSGQVITDYQAKLYSGGTVVQTALSVPWSLQARHDLSNNGIIAGVGQIYNTNTHTYTIITPLSGYTRDDFWGISENGRYLTGRTEAGNTPGPAILYDLTTGTTTILTAGSSQGLAVNDSGEVIDGNQLYINGTASVIGGHSYGLSDINNSGTVVGSITMSANEYFEPLAYSNGTATVLANLSGLSDGVASGINDAGWIAGRSFNVNPYYVETTSTDRAWLNVGGNLVDLTSLLPGNSGITLTNAIDVNNHGQIAVEGIGSDGQRHGFLLDITYVPEPSPLILFGSLFAALAIARKARNTRLLRCR